MQQRLKAVLFFTILSFGLADNQKINAQGTGGGCGGVGEDADIPCPIDGGLSFLLLAGVGYGVAKYRRQKGLAKQISTTQSETFQQVTD